MQPYSLDLRTRVAAACREPGARRQQVAERFGVSYSFITKLVRHARQTGSLAPKPARGGPARVLSAQDQAWLVAYVQQHADATLVELHVGLAGACGPGSEPDLYLAGAGRAPTAAKKKVTTLPSATRRACTRRASSTCSRSAPARTWPAFTSWTKRACAWTIPAPTPGPWAGNAWAGPCHSREAVRSRSSGPYPCTGRAPCNC